MTSNSGPAAKPVSFVPGFLALMAIGGLFGVALCHQRGDISAQRLDILLGTFCAGFAWAGILLQALAVGGGFFAFIRNPIPEKLDIGDRAAVQEHLNSLKGRCAGTVRIRNLLRAWTTGGDTRVVMELAGFQSRLAGRPVLAGGLLGTALLVIAIALRANPYWTWSGLAVLAVVVYARMILNANLDHYIEARLLARMPARIPQTAMTAADLAAALGGKIQEAFRDSVPQPEETAKAIRGAVEKVVARTAGEIEKIQQALESVVERLQAALKDHAALVQTSSGDWGDRLRDLLGTHVTNIETANRNLVEQLEKVSILEKNIEKTLHIQETVEGTFKSLAASEAFTALISSLQDHLRASDALLQELSKPRTIRLVETEGESPDKGGDTEVVKIPPRIKT